MAEIIKGGCHCGNLALTFHASKPFEDMPIRACQCTFCRKHNVRATADPEGRLEIKVADQGKLSRYRMGHGITDFLVCRDCGVYVGATMEDPENNQILATCVVNTLELDPARIAAPAEAHYDEETPGSRLERRRKRWMKVEFG
ncbi:MAG: aldehyde-activating protein [Alphaproteobacteria bacterium]|jgi:hypothetical protein|nr:aldehyde-activating protein [Alphaproteobacteria bacterium]